MNFSAERKIPSHLAKSPERGVTHGLSTIEQHGGHSAAGAFFSPRNCSRNTPCWSVCRAQDPAVMVDLRRRRI